MSGAPLPASRMLREIADDFAMRMGEDEGRRHQLRVGAHRGVNARVHPCVGQPQGG